MEKKSQAQQKLEARKQIKESFEKIEPYVMPNVSKKERAEIIAKSVNTRDCFGRKLPKESEHTEAYYVKLQEREEKLIQSIERGLDACEEDGYDIVAIEELEGEMAQIIKGVRESKIKATEISIKQLMELETKLERLVDNHEQGLKR